MLSNSIESGMINERNKINKSERNTAVTNTKTTKGNTLNQSKPSHKEIILSITALVGVYLLKKNKTLSSENQALAETNIEQDKVINIQQKVLDVSEKVKPTDLDVNLERLSNKTK
jgi:coproporphyrinogen III oxidase-like Fe-S oxidoreductase